MNTTVCVALLMKYAMAASSMPRRGTKIKTSGTLMIALATANPLFTSGSPAASETMTGTTAIAWINDAAANHRRVAEPSMASARPGSPPIHARNIASAKTNRRTNVGEATTTMRRIDRSSSERTAAGSLANLLTRGNSGSTRSVSSASIRPAAVTGTTYTPAARPPMIAPIATWSKRYVSSPPRLPANLKPLNRAIALKISPSKYGRILIPGSRRREATMNRPNGGAMSSRLIRMPPIRPPRAENALDSACVRARRVHRVHNQGTGPQPEIEDGESPAEGEREDIDAVHLGAKLPDEDRSHDECKQCQQPTAADVEEHVAHQARLADRGGFVQPAQCSRGSFTA